MTKWCSFPLGYCGGNPKGLVWTVCVEAAEVRSLCCFSFKLFSRSVLCFHNFTVVITFVQAGLAAEPSILA